MNKKRNTANGKRSVLADENVLTLYLKDISRIPLLTREEEDTIARKAAAGDKEALNKLVRANLRFVVNVAKRYQGQGLPLTDLISEGNIGLMSAVSRFDVDKGYHFISYAVWWIRQAILKAISEKSRMIRLPMNRADELLRIQRTKTELQGSESTGSEINEIAKALDMTAAHVNKLLNVSREMVSLDTPVYSEKDSCIIADHIEDETYQSPYEFAEQSLMRDDIEAVLGTLDKKEAAVIRYRFGIGDSIQMSLREIGDRFNLTKERIRQIEKKAIKRLQHPARQQKLQVYVA
ncbi:MAG: RNA polymerase sigma factor RpoD/SigA [Spirochaetaceae bacterium]|jgi:RNA polymerase primary sigma factor|nr:RNA polymerase sigma factor RpoD/SigA [Spirochaetaceae bacterium]